MWTALRETSMNLTTFCCWNSLWVAKNKVVHKVLLSAYQMPWSSCPGWEGKKKKKKKKQSRSTQYREPFITLVIHWFRSLKKKCSSLNLWLKYIYNRFHKVLSHRFVLGTVFWNTKWFKYAPLPATPLMYLSNLKLHGH